MAVGDEGGVGEHNIRLKDERVILLSAIDSIQFCSISSSFVTGICHLKAWMHQTED